MGINTYIDLTKNLDKLILNTRIQNVNVKVELLQQFQSLLSPQLDLDFSCHQLKYKQWSVSKKIKFLFLPSLFWGELWEFTFGLRNFIPSSLLYMKDLCNNSTDDSKKLPLTVLIENYCCCLIYTFSPALDTEHKSPKKMLVYCLRILIQLTTHTLIKFSLRNP